jgi:hypothetical protein
LAGILSRDDLYTKPNIGNHNWSKGRWQVLLL